MEKPTPEEFGLDSVFDEDGYLDTKFGFDVLFELQSEYVYKLEQEVLRLRILVNDKERLR